MSAALRVLLALAIGLLSLPLGAQPRAVIKPLGSGAPLELIAKGEGYVGQLTVENVGTEPLRVTALKVRPGSGSVPRLPPGVTVTFDEGRGAMAPIEPGILRTATVRWVRKGQGPTEIRGHIVVESENAEPAMLGIVAERQRSFFARRALSLLLALPLIGVIVLLAIHFGRYRRLRNVSAVPGAIAALQLGLGALIYSLFDVTLTRHHGGEGFQLVEAHALLPSLGIQYWVGIDGISAPFVLLLPLLVLIAALFGRGVDRRPIRFWSWLLVLQAGLLGCFVLLDLALWLAAWVVAAIAAVSLVSGYSAGRASLRITIHLGLASAAIALSLFSLSSRAPVTHLLDGSIAPRAWAYPELLQVAFFDSGALDAAGVKLAVTALFIGVAVLLALPPFHGWLTRALEDAPAPLGIVLAGGLPAVGAYVLVRFGFGLLPEGMAWAATTIAIIGVIGALWAALGAVAESELGRFAGYAVALHSGLVLLALAGLTGIGIEAAILLAVSRAVAVAGVLAVVAMLRERVQTADAARFGGLAAELPALGVLGAAVFLGSMALPGTLTFLGVWGALFGAFPMQPGPTLAALAVLIVAAAAHLSKYSRAFFGKVPETWRSSRFLEPHGGRFPALDRRELAALAIAAGVLIGLGFWPHAIGRLIDSSALDYAERAQTPGPTQVAAAPTPASAMRLALGP